MAPRSLQQLRSDGACPDLCYAAQCSVPGTLAAHRNSISKLARLVMLGAKCWQTPSRPGATGYHLAVPSLPFWSNKILETAGPLHHLWHGLAQD